MPPFGSNTPTPVHVVLSQFLNTFGYGDHIPHDWMRTAFNLPEPQIGSFREMRRYQIDYMEAISGLRDRLLKEHKMHLATVHTYGFRILKPSEQTEYAADTLVRDTLRVTRKAQEIVAHTDTSGFTAAQKTAHSNAQARIGTQRLAAENFAKRERQAWAQYAAPRRSPTP